MRAVLLVAASMGGGFACATPRVSVAPASMPELSRAIASADSLIEASLGRITPGAVFLVAKDGRVIHERAFGYAQLNDYEMKRLATPTPMRTSTVFDLASVTKVMATTFAMMILVDKGRVNLDAPVYTYLPDFRGPRLDSITVRHLLNHSSGLVQWQPLYYQASNSAETYRAIRDMPLGSGVGEARRYSDLGFMLLGYIVERVSGRPLDVFVDQELFGPLGLQHTAFKPRQKGLSEFAATEQGNTYERHMVYDSTFGYRYRGDPTLWDKWRKYVLVGETDDGNAFHANEGVAGHAGLFSTAADLRVLLDLLSNKGTLGRHRIVSAATVEKFLTLDRYGHYLGWQLPANAPPGSFMHTGFTGTYVVGVPRYGLSVVLLTNRQNLGTDARGYFPDPAPLRLAITRILIDAAARDASANGGTSQDRGALGAPQFEPTEFRSGRWFKGNTHTHTLESDGDSPPELVARWYKAHGYNFLVLSDHNVWVNPAKLAHLVDSGFMLIPGEELTTRFGSKPIHVNGLNIPHVIAPRTDSTLVGTVQKNVDAVREVEGVPHINHPNFGWALSKEDLSRVRNDKLIEIHNGHPLVHNEGGGDSPGMEAVWDYLLTRGKRIYGIAVDDAHHFQGEFAADRANPGRGWVTVRASRLDARDILAQMEKGRFYATTGVELDSVNVAARSISIHVRRKGDFKFTTEFIGGGGRVLSRSSTNPARYTLAGNETYVRARVSDSGGGIAWLQPVFVKR